MHIHTTFFSALSFFISPAHISVFAAALFFNLYKKNMSYNLLNPWLSSQRELGSWTRSYSRQRIRLIEASSLPHSPWAAFLRERLPEWVEGADSIFLNGCDKDGSILTAGTISGAWGRKRFWLIEQGTGKHLQCAPDWGCPPPLYLERTDQRALPVNTSCKKNWMNIIRERQTFLSHDVLLCTCCKNFKIEENCRRLMEWTGMGDR